MIDYPSHLAPVSQWDAFEARMKKLPQDNKQVQRALTAVAEFREEEKTPEAIEFRRRQQEGAAAKNAAE